MNRTNIEWVKNPDDSQGYTWNPITGCQNHDNNLCKGGGFPCYAYKLANGRLKPLYLANENTVMRFADGYAPMKLKVTEPFHPRFWEERLAEPIEHPEPMHPAKRKGIFVCDMSDLFGIGIPESWAEQVMTTAKLCPYHRFYLLTKQPQSLIKFSPFPENCWVGVTATNADMCIRAGYCFTKIEAKVKFLSLEPLLAWQHGKPGFIATMLQTWGINWLIIGACTGNLPDMNLLADRYPDLWLAGYKGKTTAQPRIEWVREIVEAADKAGIPVFLKDNLRPLLIPDDGSKPNYLLEDIFWASEKAQLRQEMPIVKKEEAQCSLCD